MLTTLLNSTSRMASLQTFLWSKESYKMCLQLFIQSLQNCIQARFQARLQNQYRDSKIFHRQNYSTIKRNQSAIFMQRCSRWSKASISFWIRLPFTLGAEDRNQILEKLKESRS